MSHTNYTSAYASKLMRGNDITERPLLAVDFASKYGGTDKKLIDIGCGTAQKSLQLAKRFHTTIGLEPSPDLLQIAQTNLRANNTANCHIVEGLSQAIPFKTNTFDTAVAILSWWDVKEVYRILQPHGIFIIECLGPAD